MPITSRFHLIITVISDTLIQKTFLTQEPPRGYFKMTKGRPVPCGLSLPSHPAPQSLGRGARELRGERYPPPPLLLSNPSALGSSLAWAGPGLASYLPLCLLPSLFPPHYALGTPTHCPLPLCLPALLNFTHHDNLSRCTHRFPPTHHLALVPLTCFSQQTRLHVKSPVAPCPRLNTPAPSPSGRAVCSSQHPTLAAPDPQPRRHPSIPAEI